MEVPSDVCETVDSFTLLPRRLGEGSFSRIFLARHNPTGERVAAKVVNKHKMADSADRAHVTRSVQLLQQLNHVNLCRVAWILETSSRVYLFLEYAEGGSLLDQLRRRGRLPETDARTLFVQLTSAVHYCHQQGVIHRNIKLQNVLVTNKNIVKLTSFGFANEFSRRRLLATIQESPHFVAPEILLGTIDQSAQPSRVDMWSIGVVLYAMLSGRLPFIHPHMKSLGRLIVGAPHATPSGISEEGVSLLRWLLSKSPEDRPDATDVLEHAWLAGVTNPAASLPCDSDVDATVTHELVEMGLAGPDGIPRVPRSKQQLVRTLMAIRVRREHGLAHEVPLGLCPSPTTPPRPGGSASDSSGSSDEEEDDSVVPCSVPVSPTASTTAGSPTSSLDEDDEEEDSEDLASGSVACAADQVLLSTEASFGARKRDLSECDEDSELPEADDDHPQAPPSPSRPNTPANLGPGISTSPAKRARVSPSPPPADDASGPAGPAQFV
eukprot:m.52382 g.52382  ORF g.52382 m.52382 type:complete len:495 (-) comp11769_c0_seq2:314-1798(-)